MLQILIGIPNEHLLTILFRAWADVDDDLPQPEIIDNKDGTKTVITYRRNDNHKIVKIIQKIKHTVIKEHVHPAVAERKKWKKYGEEKTTPPGPDLRTTQLGEPVQLKLSTNLKALEHEEEQKQKEESSKKITSTGLKCRTCGGEHFTSKCPFKDTLGASLGTSATPTPDEVVAAASAAPEGGKSGAFIPPHLRNRKEGDVRSPSGRFERDDSTTLRITQLNEIVDEDMLRNELLYNYQPLQRVTLVRNKETGKSKGLAYVAFRSVEEAERALEDLNGRGYHNLILHLEWSKPKVRS